MRFMLPIESIDWTRQITNISSDENTFYFSLKEYNQALKILNNNSFNEIPVLVLTGVNSQFLLKISRSMKVDKIVSKINII